MSLSKKSKIAFGSLAVIAIIVFAVYKYSMLPPTQIEDKKVDFTGTSQELLSKVQENAAEWQDKVVIISGKITSLDDKGFILSSSIYCQLKESSKVSTLSPEKEISLKGRVIGYDDLLEELKLDQCIIQ
jgi:hypothetical protein